jgi:hypothetical protein
MEKWKEKKRRKEAKKWTMDIKSKREREIFILSLY